MAEKRRRKRVKSSEDSEEYSDVSEAEQSFGKESEAESELEKPSGAESEYESAEEEDTSATKVDEISKTPEVPAAPPENDSTTKPDGKYADTSTLSKETSSKTELVKDHEEKATKPVEIDSKSIEVDILPIETVSKLQEVHIEIKSTEVDTEQIVLDTKLAEVETKTIEVETKQSEMDIITSEVDIEPSEVNKELIAVDIKTAEFDNKPLIDIKTLDVDIKTLEVDIKPLIDTKILEVENKTPVDETKALEVDIKILTDTKTLEIEMKMLEIDTKTIKVDSKLPEVAIKAIEVNSDLYEVDIKHVEKEDSEPEGLVCSKFETVTSMSPITTKQPDSLPLFAQHISNKDNSESILINENGEISLGTEDINYDEEIDAVGEMSTDLIDEEGGMEDTAEAECEFLEDEDDLELEEGEIIEEDTEGYVEGERQQGDGEESVSPTPSKEKKLDDDEDRRNPQYIPKKGSFYEHDDRMTSDQEQASQEDEKEEENEKPEDKKKKKLWLEDGRWKHDMFREDEQNPKTRDEMLSSYGYDIRSEESAPRARRRRRYGRGPNKYTRNWQDEQAYFKSGGEPGTKETAEEQEESFDGRRGTGQSGAQRRGGRVSRSGFRGRNNSEEEPQTKNNNQTDNNNVVLDKEDFPALPTVSNGDNNKNILAGKVTGVRGSKPPFSATLENETEKPVLQTLMFQNSRFTNRNSSERNEKEDVHIEHIENKFPEMSRPNRGRGRGNQRAPRQEMIEKDDRHFSQRSHPVGNPNRKPIRGRGHSVQQDVRDNRMRFSEQEQDYPQRPLSREEMLEHKMEKLTLNSNKSVSQPSPRIKDTSGNNQQSKGGGEGRSKRYSSIRQRGGPENTASPAFHQTTQGPVTGHQQYYERPNNGSYQAAAMYAERASRQANNQQQNVNQQGPVSPLIPGAPLFPAYNPAYQENFGMRPNMPNAPRMFPAPNIGPVPGPPVASNFIAPPPAPNSNLLNYGPSAAPTAIAAGLPQYPYQQFNAHPPAAAPPIAMAPAGATVVVSQPQELYQGGVTYYNTHNQQLQLGRMPPQKRPKAAIPIVSPSQTLHHIEGYNTSEMIDEEELDECLISNTVSVET